MNYADTSGHHYTPAEDAEIRRLRDDLKLTWPEISKLVGRPSAGGVRCRYLRRENTPPPASGKMRVCMRRGCHTQFLSPHAGVRMCDPCRAGTYSPLEPDDYTGAGDLALSTAAARVQATTSQVQNTRRRH